MAIQKPIGVKYVGSTAWSEILVNTADIEVIPVTIAGNQSLTLNPGCVLQDGAGAYKVGYTNADVTPTGFCILLDKVTIASGDPDVIANALVRGTVKKSAILDDAGAAADAAAVAGLKNVLML